MRTSNVIDVTSGLFGLVLIGSGAWYWYNSNVQALGTKQINRRRSHQSGPSTTRLHGSRVALMRLAPPRRKTLVAPEGYVRFAAIGWPRCGWRLSRISALAGRCCPAHRLVAPG